MAANKKRERNLIAYTGAAAVAAVAINLIVSAVNAHREKLKKKKGLAGTNVRINLSASEIKRLADDIIAKSKEVYDSVASVPLEKVTYMNVIAPLAELEAYQFPLVQSCLFPKKVSPLEDVRKASSDAEIRLDSFFLMCRKREDVYRVIKAFVEKGEWLGPEAKQYIQCLVRDYERNGINLTLSKRKELEYLRSRLDNLSAQYIQNLNEDNSFLLLGDHELAGMPPEFIKSLEKTESAKLKVHLRNHHVSPILEHCKVGATRKLVAVAYNQRRGKENLVVLDSLIQLRHKFARLLGYSNYADFVIEPRMAKNSAKVFEFLEDISASVTGLANIELSMLKDLKRIEEGDSPFGMEDLLYYMKRAEERHLNLDLGEVKQYFPFNLVLSGIFKIFQDLFGLRFEEISNAEVWHGTVCLYSILDFSTSELLGYLYLDMFSREGKYTHTCILPLQNGCLSGGTRQIPVAILISQCPKPIDQNPVLLRFSEVVSLCHEFTHVVHHICNQATFARFSGLRIEADFSEIPSQLLENWCYEGGCLKMMSGFHQDITKSITSEMCRALKRRRDMFSGLKLKQEILFCLIDQIIHSSEDVDIVELLKDLHPKVMLGIPLLEGTNPASCFPRYVVGCEAICYSYLWSEAFAADIFASKFKDDLQNQTAGLQLRNKVLAPGGAKDPLEILRNYLGREPSIDSFIDSKTRNSW
ncbi:uncharacterized protein A4U43_C04F5730 [Asparagus officinalis]|uniref:Peptidase M3A/M3B catalytic domain-containing protein n=1 Tax=Asparagus officinalis TaxID=4686 RepID=A0A5P1EZ19_ASPOF|nr:probable thimet oligopeptidase [Asparagus officinalis]ONK71182.1 uncharacterized protein A4U43_C04F5730 [Asparagus officinalis]